MCEYTLETAGEKIFAIPYPQGPEAGLSSLPSCSTRARFPESVSFGGQSESWPARGPPERPTRLVAKVERREAQRPRPLGARDPVCRAGWEGNPASKGASQALWRLPPLHRPRALSARDRQTSDALRRENAKAWLFE